MVKIIRALEDSDILMKVSTETLQNDVKKGGTLPILLMLLGTLGLSYLEDGCTGLVVVIINVIVEKECTEQDKELKKKSLILPKPHLLTNFEIISYFKDEPRFNGVYSRNNLPKTKNGAYIINLDEYADAGTHWIALHLKNNEATYFDSFGVEYIPKEIKKFTKNKDIKTNIFRIQAYNSIMCGYFCILFIDFMFKGKTLNDFTNLFSPYDF